MIVVLVIKRYFEMLETERLILRPFTENDAEDLYEYLKEPMVNCFASMKKGIRACERFRILFCDYTEREWKSYWRD